MLFMLRTQRSTEHANTVFGVVVINVIVALFACLWGKEKKKIYERTRVRCLDRSPATSNKYTRKV